MMGGLDWVNLAPDMYMCRAVVDMVMNFRIP
jgi:hypothetical protein